MKTTKMNLTQYAKTRGYDRKTVRAACEAGRIPAKRVRGRWWILDPVAADAAWKSNTDPGQALRGKGNKPDATGDYYAQKTREAASRARLNEIEIAEKEARLLDAEAVETRVRELAEHAKATLLGMPDRVAAVLAAESDERRVRAVLDAEIREALKTIAAGPRDA